MPWEKVLKLFQLMRAGQIGVNNMTRAAEAHVREYISNRYAAYRADILTNDELVAYSYADTAREGFDVLFARRQLRSEVSLDLAENALKALAATEK